MQLQNVQIMCKNHFLLGLLKRNKNNNNKKMLLVSFVVKKQRRFKMVPL